MESRQSSQGISRLSLFLLVALLAYSCLGVWSTSVVQEGSYGLFYKHLFSIGLGFAVFVTFSLVGYRLLQSWAPFLYGLLLVLLLWVLIMGPSVAGSRRWIFLGGFSFQPSEFAKMVLTMTLSIHLSRISRWTPGQIILLLVHIGLPCLLVLREPDLGMTLVLIGLFFSMLLVSPFSSWILGLSLSPLISIGLYFWNESLWRLHLIGAAVALLVLAVVGYLRQWGIRGLLVFGTLLLTINGSVIAAGTMLWSNLKPYQQERILTFISPNPDTLSSGYQVQQSKIAVGAGGWTGQGLFQGSQTQLGFVPEQHTDFIFSALAEETGFLGAGFLLLLFTCLVFRILWIGFQAQEDQQLYICTGVASLLLMQLLINLGMNMDMMPVTGVPLPLISYGGTAMLFQMSLLGLVESVYRQQKRPDLSPELNW